MRPEDKALYDAFNTRVLKTDKRAISAQLKQRNMTQEEYIVRAYWLLLDGYFDIVPQIVEKYKKKNK